MKGKRTDVLPLIGTLRKLVNHPYLVYQALKTSKGDNDTTWFQTLMMCNADPEAAGLAGIEQFFPKDFDKKVPLHTHSSC